VSFSNALLAHARTHGGALRFIHAVIAPQAAAFDYLRETLTEDVMRRLYMLLIPMAIIAMSGCVVAPYGYHRGYYGPRVAIVAPAPVVVVRRYR
jgi:hypothetical protein